MKNFGGQLDDYNDDDTEGVQLRPLTQHAADCLDRGEMPA